MTARQEPTETVSADWVRRYLALLGVERQAPSLAALAELMRAQILAVPFENVTAILRRHAHPGAPVPPVDPEGMLSCWERQGGGGVCFELAELFSRLLGALGYAAYPILAQISFPGSHQAVIVELDGARYLVDVGNAAPFFAPVPLDRVTEVRGVGLAYRFRPDAADEVCVQDRLIAGAWEPYCTYFLRRPSAGDREVAYQHHHTPGETWVVGTPRLVRCEAEAISTLRDGVFSRYTTAGKETRSVTEAADYERLAVEVFGLPALPIAAGIKASAELNAAAV